MVDPIRKTSEISHTARCLIIGGLGATGVVLLLHAFSYRFLTDDAYIVFRYAQNLSEGAGLVFNPGFERVEGYTDFLWVVILGALHRFGIAPETSAIFLSMAFTIGLWMSVVWFARRLFQPNDWPPAVLVAPLLLAATRSIAVWSTGGLETRAFEFLVVLGVLRLLVESESFDQSSRPAPVAALLLALATLTRPDGLLISVAAGASLLACLRKNLRTRLRWLGLSVLIFVVLVGGHYVFRRAYYGAWLPNTFYAKVGGQMSWAMGRRYLEMFALEYGIYLWPPLIIAGIAWHRQRRSLRTPMVFGAVILSHALYVASIGGDHFEYRPLDFYFPFIYLTMGAGAAFWARERRSRFAVTLGIALLLGFIMEIPAQSHRQFPRQYEPGFPGKTLETTAATDSLGSGSSRRIAESFLDPNQGSLSRLPGLKQIAHLHQSLLRTTTSKFVGVRQEEHKLFLAQTVRQGRALKNLVDGGVLPKDTYIAIDCVGAIPYLCGLRTLDRLGLTDAHVARSRSVREVMAHEKQATEDYGRQRGVDLWAVDNVYLYWNLAEPEFCRNLLDCCLNGRDAYFASLGGGNYLLASLPGGIERARRRFPALEFESTLDQGKVSEILDTAAKIQLDLESGNGP